VDKTYRRQRLFAQYRHHVFCVRVAIDIALSQKSGAAGVRCSRQTGGAPRYS
jgi:hypothetical protein